MGAEQHKSPSVLFARVAPPRLRAKLLAPLVCLLVLAAASAAAPAGGWSAAGRSGAIAATSAIPVVTKVSVSWWHTCALTDSGAVKCWGAGGIGELGNGTYTGSVIPVDVVGLGSGVTAITTGSHHACAVTAAGAAKCWGDNSEGQLGNGTTQKSASPVAVTGLGSGVVSITAGGGAQNGTHGGGHTCALTSAGAVKCWGRNDFGQLGDGTYANSQTPVDVVGLGSGVVAIDAGGEETCALTSGGAVKCWGDNRQGQLGNGTRSTSSVPVGVKGLSSGVVAIATGGLHACALTSAGAAKCWGYDFFGDLGDGGGGSKTTPVGVVGLGSGVSQISAKGYDSCALTSAGAVKCWGYNGAGQVGDGTTATRYTPVDVSGLDSGVEGVSTSGWDTCAVMTGGNVECWGSNVLGGLGDGTTTDRSTPVEVRWTVNSIVITITGPFTPGSPFRVEARMTDPSGQTMTDYNGPATWSSLGGLSPATPADFVNGVSTTMATIATPFHADTISMFSGDAVGRSRSFDVVGPFALINVSVPSSVSAGGSFAVKAIATDSAGNALTSYSGSATWSALGGGLTPVTPASFAGGVSTTNASIATANQNDRITVTSGGVSGQSNFFTVVAPASIGFKVATPVSAGAPFTVLAYARNALGQTMADYNARATWSDLSGRLSPAVPGRFVNGVSTTQATVATPFHNDRITLTAGGVSGTSGPFSVHGPFARIVVRVATPVTRGVPFTVKATATDDAGNPVPTYDGVAAWTSLSGGLTPVAPSAFTAGVSTTSATITAPFVNNRITVTSGGISGQSGFFNVH